MYLALQEHVQVHALNSGQPVRRGPAYRIPGFLQGHLPLEPAVIGTEVTTDHSPQREDVGRSLRNFCL